MRFSKPARRVQLVSLGAQGITIDELLTAKLPPRSRWLTQGVSIGDAAIFPARLLLDFFENLGHSDYFQHFNLRSIKADGLENLWLVGSDGDGHEYVTGIRSGQFYAMWHGEPSSEPVAKTPKAFIQWVIRKRSDHLEGCPWEVFLTGTKRMHLETVWHRDQVDPEPLLEKARAISEWDRQYVSPLGFELFDEKNQVSLRFKKEHRGHNSHVQTLSQRKSPKLELYRRWLAGRGFGRVWH